MKQIKIIVMTVLLTMTMLSEAKAANKESVLANKNDKYILTPPVSEKPRINGARVFGARPSAPFLFKVAATGQKPLQYEAARLPDGLKIDNENGLITGKVAKAGTYKVDLTISNQLGTAKRQLRIEIGDKICLTPPMGWNSWYCWSEAVSDKKMRQMAKAMHDKGLIDHGWTYVNIDDCWQGARGGELNAIMPNERFPDMKALCDYIHGLGLKAGIYSTPWMGSYAGFIGGSALNAQGDYSEKYLPADKRLQKTQFFGRYPGLHKAKVDRVGPYWFADKDAQQWSRWGFDYVKYDWKPNDIPTATRLMKSLENCGRDIIYSISNAAPFENALGLSQVSNLWRTTGDIQDNWASISRIGFSQDKWAPYAGPGHWNDPDMLQVGNVAIPNNFVLKTRPSNLTADEQYTQMSLWCLLASPLLLSCDIESLDAFTLNLLTNDEVLQVNQDPLGIQARRVKTIGQLEIWAKAMEDGSQAVGLFNRSDAKAAIEVDFANLELHGKQKVRDLWRQKDLGTFQNSFTGQVNSHGVLLLNISTE
ncbi:MAG: putative Ig domain-containing protein [Phycisphaerae bacterium]|nr:putative Ig domain-containing protein [Phycisphaerae bacterium]